jgi:quinol monooxygenase YgiN
MITEVAVITIDPLKAEAFEAAVNKALPLFHKAEGWKSLSLERCIEDSSKYYLFAQWGSVEDHTVKFRGSEDFKAWRALVGPFFVGTPVVLHTSQVLRQ